MIYVLVTGPTYLRMLYKVLSTKMMLKAPCQWVASPLGYNVLLSMLKEASPLEKYIQLNQFGHLRWHEFGSKTELIIANICSFESTWQLNKKSDIEMKLYNSSNYTDDVRYEGRLLEIPLSLEDFKLVLLIPNETDVLSTLFSRLTSHGMAAAVSTLHPMFTAKSVITAPRVDVISRVHINEKISEMPDALTIQYGAINVSDIGTRIQVWTCLYYPANTVTRDDEVKTTRPPYYFALVYNDTPIFYGDINSLVI
ncbi:uncharacterized protein LOC124638444 isoform X3 [Helicoverpa zea]|uniref:uncharacterized protein LOC124638444 isoform X3 n=1 Tax=Helicoverpa zea TaxID=7113 RepID=UPI001F588852|nr:uncharacterized protein LOC124638444 isoform X3 [Helicoverpa zea]